MNENDYYILTQSRIIRGKFIKKFKLDESPDSMLRDAAVEFLISQRGMSRQEADQYLNSLPYVPTRGG